MTSFIKCSIVSLLLLAAMPAGACFGPKLYFGTTAGEDGELLFHLVAIYLQEKTGVESIRVETTDDQGAEQLLQQNKIDLVFSATSSDQWGTLLTIEDQLFLLSGPRPTGDLQFTTIPKALQRLQARLKLADLTHLRRQVSAGVLPAVAVRKFYMQRGWI